MTRCCSQRDSSTIMNFHHMPLVMGPGMGSRLEAEQSSGADTEPDLASSIWEELPVHLLVVVLSKLPVSALKKFCRVSKAWKALIVSEEFAQDYDSAEATALYLEPWELHLPYIGIPNMKTDSWEKHLLDFIRPGERVRLHAACHGLLCYRILKETGFFEKKEIILIIHNPLTRKWRRLVVPFLLETRIEERMCLSKMLIGLTVDQRTGRYKVVVAFFDENLTRNTFIYDSSSNSWTTSDAVSPVLHPGFVFPQWYMKNSICCGGELFWLVEELDDVHCKGHFKSLIKYSIKLDTWSVETQQLPCPQRCGLHLTTFENRPYMVKFENFMFPHEFFSLVPDMGKFDAEDVARLLNEAGDTKFPDRFKARKAFAEGGTWFILAESESEFGFIEESIFVFNRSPPTVVRLPKLQWYHTSSLFTFAPTFKAFV